MIAFLKHKLNVWKSVRHEKAKEKTRSPKWQGVRDEFLKKYPKCSACESDDHLQVHHVKPFHVHPELELVETNLIGLCMSPDECHLAYGHAGNFSYWNPKVREQTALARLHPGSRKELRKEAIKCRQK